MIKFNDYIVDVATKEVLTYEAEVTEYPVERGGVVTDHTNNRPPVLALEFVVSDTPIGEVAKVRAANVVPSSEAQAFLVKLRGSKQPFTVECSLGTFDNLIFATLEFPKDKDTGAALIGSATCRQIDIRDIERIVITAAPVRRNLGRRAAQLTDADTKFFLQGPHRDPPYTERDEVHLNNAGHWLDNQGVRLTDEQEDRLQYQYAKRDLQYSHNADGRIEWRTVRTGGLPTDAGTSITRSNSPIGNITVVPNPPPVVREPIERGHTI